MSERFTFEQWSARQRLSKAASEPAPSSAFRNLQNAYSIQVINTELIDALKDLVASTANWFVGGFPHAAVARAHAVIEQAEQFSHQSMAPNEAIENTPSPRNTIAQTTER